MKQIKDIEDFHVLIVLFVLRNRLKVSGSTRLEKIKTALCASTGMSDLPYHSVFCAVFKAGQEILNPDNFAKTMLNSTSEDVLGFYKANEKSSISTNKLLENILDDLQFSPFALDGCGDLISKYQKYCDSFDPSPYLLKSQNKASENSKRS